MRIPSALFSAALGLLSFSLLSCGPIYNTDYHYLPPETYDGAGCIGGCEGDKQKCLIDEHYQKANCESQSNWDKANCEAEIWARENRKPKWYECSGELCSENTVGCESEFRYCYQRCGGRVIEERRCVYNCEQIPQAKPVAQIKNTP